MYVVVQERTKEIGIRRASGAKRKTILGQFILEAFVVIGVGAMIGFLLAVAIISIFAALPIQDFKDAVGTPQLNPMVAVVTVFILGTIGFLAGFFPARRASRLNVVDALRY
jgi:putative ABC transport system permease protein